MSDQTSPSSPSINLLQFLIKCHNPDGTINRTPLEFLKTPVTSDHTDQSTAPVLCMDIPINQSNNTWARIFLPRQTLVCSNNNKNKLPLIVYFHGGGFVLFSAATNFFPDFCLHMAQEVPAIVVSIDHRLAPEHRLPAAYDDAIEALHWIKNSHEARLRQYADYANCFIMGSSSGGNIAFHAGLRVSKEVDDFEPLNIKGLILHQPFFGGVQKTKSELNMVHDLILPPGVTDLMWELSFPIGVNRDHEYCNPMVGGESKLIEQMGLRGWSVLVTGFYGDPLVDRQIEVVKLMGKEGVKVRSKFTEGGYHGLDLTDSVERMALFATLKDFLESSQLVAA